MINPSTGNDTWVCLRIKSHQNAFKMAIWPLFLFRCFRCSDKPIRQSPLLRCSPCSGRMSDYDELLDKVKTGCGMLWGRWLQWLLGKSFLDLPLTSQAQPIVGVNTFKISDGFKMFQVFITVPCLYHTWDDDKRALFLLIHSPILVWILSFVCWICLYVRYAAKCAFASKKFYEIIILSVSKHTGLYPTILLCLMMFLIWGCDITSFSDTFIYFQELPSIVWFTRGNG
jgi:hypothetical protein